jgi:voltage-gated potassium channel
MLDTVTDHFIICGYGRIGRLVAAQLSRQQIPFVIVERDPGRLKTAIDDGALAVEGDASGEDMLKRVGIDRARGLIAAVGTDAENVYAVLTARVLRPDLFIVSRADTDDATMKLKRAGADRVISPYQIGAIQIAQTALRPAVVDFFERATRADSLELAMEQIPIGGGSSLANQSILRANLRQRFGVIVVGIQRQDLRMEFNPEPETAIRPGNKLVVLGRPESLKRLEAEASS